MNVGGNSVMQLLFIRPLLEGLLGIEKNSDMSRRYGFNDGTMQKITSSRYEVMNEGKDFVMVRN